VCDARKIRRSELVTNLGAIGTVLAAFLTSRVTSSGWETMATWLDGISMVTAPMRPANWGSASGGLVVGGDQVPRRQGLPHGGVHHVGERRAGDADSEPSDLLLELRANRPFMISRSRFSIGSSLCAGSRRLPGGHRPATMTHRAVTGVSAS
jgi:hypothetical protein